MIILDNTKMKICISDLLFAFVEQKLPLLVMFNIMFIFVTSFFFVIVYCLLLFVPVPSTNIFLVEK